MSALRAFSALPRAMWVLFAATLVNRAGWMVVPFLALYLTRSLHRSVAEAGVVIAAYGAAGLVTSPIAGALSDRLGAMRVMRASLFLSAAVLFAFPLATSYPAALAATALLGFVHELYRPASLALVSAIAREEERRPAFALVRLAQSLGMSVGPAVGGLLAGMSFTLLFAVDAVTTLLAAVVLVIAFRADAGNDAGIRPPPGSALLAALGDRKLALALAVALPVIMVFSQHFSTLSLYAVRDLGVSEEAYGLTFTVNTLLIVTLQVPVTWATSRWPSRRVLALGALLTGVGFGANALCRSAPALCAAVVPWTIGEMLFLPSLSAHVADIASAERRGTYMGLCSMTFNLAFAVGPWLGGIVVASHGPRALWAGCLVAGVLAAVMTARMTPSRAA